MKVKSAISSLTGLFVATALLACGRPQFKAYNSAQTPLDQRTGPSEFTHDPHGNVYEKPYTISGFQSQFDEVKENVEGPVDENFSLSIDDIRILHTDQSNVLQSEPSSHLTVKITLKTSTGGGDESSQSITFNFPRDSSSNTQVSGIKSTSHRGQRQSYLYELDLQCLSINCGNAKVFLHKYERTSGKKGPRLATAGALVTLSQAKVRVETTSPGYIPNDTELKRLQDIAKDSNLAEELEAQKRGVAVHGGKSFAELTIADPAALPEAPPLVHVRTPILETNLDPSNIDSISLGGKEQKKCTELIGNNPTSGDLALEIADECTPGQSNPNGSIQLYVDTTDSDNEDKPHWGEGEGLPDAAQPTAFLRVDYPQDPNVNPDVAVVHEITEKLDRYKNHPNVHKHIGIWQGTKKIGGECHIGAKGQHRKGMATGFFINAQPLVSTIQKVARFMGTSPEIAYLGPMESRYSHDGTYKIEKATGSSAAGPMQITDDTARWARDLIHGFTGNRDIHLHLLDVPVAGSDDNLIPSADDRNYFEPSFLMTAALARNYISSLPDPALFFYAYHRGKGGALSDLKGESIRARSLSDLDHYNMGDCVIIDYAFAILALRFIGHNPSAYGFDVPNQPGEAPHNLFRPTGPIVD